MPPLPVDRLLDPAYLFDINPGSPSDWYAILAVLFGLIVIVSQGGYYLWAKAAFANDPFRLRLVRVAAIALGSVSSVAILLIVARYLTIPVLSMRFLLVLAIIVAIGMVVFFAYYMTQIYPRKSVLVEREAFRQRYLPQQRPKQVPTPSRKRRRGKKKK